MNVNSSSITASSTPDVNRAQEAQRTAQNGRADGSKADPHAADDDVQLSELVRSLRSLAPDSTERQQFIEQLGRAVESGNYQVNAEATADALIRDSVTLAPAAVAAAQG